MSDQKEILVKYSYSEPYRKAILKYRQSEHGIEKIKQYSVHYHQEHKDDPEYIAKKREYSKQQYQKLKQRKEHDQTYVDELKAKRREYYLKRKNAKLVNV